MEAHELADRIYRNAAGTLELYAIYLGEQLGLYEAMASGDWTTPAELAARTGTAERYMREWLEHHAVSELVEVEDPAAEPRRYRLPPAHVKALVDRDDLDYSASSAVELARIARQLPSLVHAYRTGTAPPPLPWEPEGRAEPNRPEFVNLLGTEWLPTMADVDARLRAMPPARVCDIACGTGWSSIATALAYPDVIVHGLDLDEAAIAAAGRNAERAGVADRVSFAAANAATLAGHEPYDLVMIIEALHDMSRPVDALKAARALLADDGAMLVVDVAVAPEFTAPGSLRDRYEYGWSLVGCLPAAMDDPDTAATGTVMRPATLSRYATEAGFTAVTILPIETDYWRFYRLR
jgi:2-polyprenyl-3-methyl-5-hydroxy-6-metoxy-1,4-benzoquinol methylase